MLRIRTYKNPKTKVVEKSNAGILISSKIGGQRKLMIFAA
jgi:hypothetical protein